MFISILLGMGYKQSKASEIICASEIGQFSFCSVAWYLQKQGYKPDSAALVRGEKAHYILGKQLEAFDYSQHIIRVLIRLGILVFIIGLICFIGLVVL